MENWQRKLFFKTKLISMIIIFFAIIFLGNKNELFIIRLSVLSIGVIVVVRLLRKTLIINAFDFENKRICIRNVLGLKEIDFIDVDHSEVVWTWDGLPMLKLCLKRDELLIHARNIGIDKLNVLVALINEGKKHESSSSVFGERFRRIIFTKNRKHRKILWAVIILIVGCFIILRKNR